MDHPSRSSLRALALALLAVSALTGCRDPSVRCASVTGSLPGTVTLNQCTDRRNRTIECPRAPGEKDAELFCACRRNGTLGATFTLFSDTVNATEDPARALYIANRRCHFDLSTRP